MHLLDPRAASTTGRRWRPPSPTSGPSSSRSLTGRRASSSPRQSPPRDEVRRRGPAAPSARQPRGRLGRAGLLDHLLGEHRRGKRDPPGYETELSTHLEVATAVAEGRADVAWRARPARGLGLDFVPLTWERYDLLTTEVAFYREPTQAFFEMVKSDWLRQLIAKVPGYDARETGLLTVIQPA